LNGSEPSARFLLFWERFIFFFFPLLLDFKTAIPVEGTKLKPLKLLFIHYETKRSDVLGIAWVMNYCVSFVLVSIGVVNLCAKSWVASDLSWLINTWISLWWFIRAFSQFHLGRRRGDWLVFVVFVFCGTVQALFIIK
jgi:hypothetical protein